jgi:hypothetical protein
VIGDDLEAALRASWSTDTLAVYADHLMSLGDPRGELIALDLHPVDEPAWHARRRVLLYHWLGADHSWGHLVQHGFVHEVRAGHPRRELFSGPLGEVIRGFSTWGTAYAIRDPLPYLVVRSLEQLVAQPRPWLTRIAIEYDGDERCSDALTRAVIAATPNLVELYSVGKPVFDSFRHPTLQRLYASQPPETDAEVIALDDCGYVPRSLALADDRLRTWLAAIEATPDCNQLYVRDDLVGPHDSVPAMVVRLHIAKAVKLDGPFVRLTPAARCVLHATPTEHPPFAPHPPPGPHVRGLRICHPDGESSQGVPAERHRAFVAACLERMPVDDATRAALEHYVAFTAGVTERGIAYDGDVGALVAAFETLDALDHFADHGLDWLALGDPVDWRTMRAARWMLGGIHEEGLTPIFRVT